MAEKERIEGEDETKSNQPWGMRMVGEPEHGILDDFTMQNITWTIVVGFFAVFGYFYGKWPQYFGESPNQFPELAFTMYVLGAFFGAGMVLVLIKFGGFKLAEVNNG